MMRTKNIARVAIRQYMNAGVTKSAEFAIVTTTIATVVVTAANPNLVADVIITA